MPLNEPLIDLEQIAERNHITVIDSAKTDTERVIFGSDGVIRIYSVSEMHTEEDAIKITGIVRQLVKDKKVPILIDSTRMKEMTPESRKYYMSEAATTSASAIAIVIDSGITRAMGNFFMDLKKFPGPPRRFFNDELKAAAWLLNFLNPSPSLEPEAGKVEVLIYEPVAQIQKPVIYSLIKNGIRCICLNNKKDIKPKLNSKKYSIFICSCSPETKDIIDIIREIKISPVFNFIKVILLAASSEQKVFFESMIKLGIKGIILKPIIQDVFENKILRLIYQSDHIPDNRQIIRVEPGENERILAAIRSSSTHKTIVGKLKSLSMDGMVLELTGEFTDDDLKLNDVIENNNIKITIEENALSMNGIVRIRKQNIVVIKFTDVQEYYKNMLSAYIYKKMNS